MLIEERLKAANGRRVVRTLGIESVRRAINEVAKGAEFCSFHGGSVTSSYGYAAITTIVVAARVDGQVYWDITTCPAHAASPGRAWPCLRPCGLYPRGNAEEKIKTWSKRANKLTKEERNFVKARN